MRSPQFESALTKALQTAVFCGRLGSDEYAAILGDPAWRAVISRIGWLLEHEQLCLVTDAQAMAVDALEAEADRQTKAKVRRAYLPDAPVVEVLLRDAAAEALSRGSLTPQLAAVARRLAAEGPLLRSALRLLGEAVGVDIPRLPNRGRPRKDGSPAQPTKKPADAPTSAGSFSLILHVYPGSEVSHEVR